MPLHPVGLLGLISVSALLGACAYESVVMAPNYASHIPESLTHIRAFFRRRTPAHFFRFASPFTALVLVLAAVLSWQSVPERWFVLGALVFLAIAEAITFSVHYRRNKTLFIDPLSNDSALLAQTARSWARWNVVRLVLLACAVASLGTSFSIHP